MQSIYARKATRVEGFTVRWTASSLAKRISAEVDHNICFPSQKGRQGLGHGNFKAIPSLADKRQLASAQIESKTQEDLLTHAVSLPLQGVWTAWCDHVNVFDFSWQNLIYGPGPKVLSFVLNCMINSVRTPDMMALWKYTNMSFCPLCAASRCTLHHILGNCSFSLNQKRYTWRHDSVLSNIVVVLQTHIQRLNQSPPTDTRPPHISKSFISQKTAAKNRLLRGVKGPTPSLLQPARDWTLAADVGEDRLLFPPEIYATPLRPDCVIWSKSVKTVILVELTCPAEEGIQAANIRKTARYESLVANINDDTNWKALSFPIEVGARGLVGISTHKFFRKVGLTNRLTTRACKALSVVVARCSYAIYLAYKSKNWDMKRELITVLTVPSPEPTPPEPKPRDPEPEPSEHAPSA